MNIQNTIFSHVGHGGQNAMVQQNFQNSYSQICQQNIALQREVTDLQAKNKSLESQLEEEKRNTFQLKNEIARLKEQLNMTTHPQYQTHTTSQAYHADVYQPNIAMLSQPMFWSQPQDQTSIPIQNHNVLSEFLVVNSQNSALQPSSSTKKSANISTMPYNPSRSEGNNKSTQYAVIFPCRKCIEREKSSKTGKATSIVKRAKRVIHRKNFSNPNTPAIRRIVSPPPSVLPPDRNAEDGPVESRSQENPESTTNGAADPLDMVPFSVASQIDPDLAEEFETRRIEQSRKSSKKRLSTIINTLSKTARPARKKKSDGEGKKVEKKTRKKPVKKNQVSENGETSAEKPKRPKLPKEPVKCQFCDKSFMNRSNLKSHERSHTGERPYKCDFCEKDFKDGNGLSKHVRTHTGEKPFHCNFCDKSFGKRENLRNHERIHTGERPFECNFCNKTFNQPNALKKHLVIHTGDKKYPCPHCHLSFKRSDHLRQHLRLHTDERPYECKECGSRFHQKTSLDCHMRSNHGEKERSRKSVHRERSTAQLAPTQVSIQPIIISSSQPSYSELQKL